MPHSENLVTDIFPLDDACRVYYRDRFKTNVDAVVYVIDCHSFRYEDCVQAVKSDVEWVLTETDPSVPILLAANKQDLRGSAKPATVLQLLEIPRLIAEHCPSRTLLCVQGISASKARQCVEALEWCRAARELDTSGKSTEPTAKESTLRFWRRKK